MVYDVRLADRVRLLLADDGSVVEQRMFGGLAFLVTGRIAVAASSEGGLLVRVDPARTDHLLATTNARAMQMRSRVIQGWLHVDGHAVRTQRQLAEWIAIGMTTAEKHIRPGANR